MERKGEICSNCSRCCQPEGIEIRLTPRDTFAIAYQKNMSTKEFVEKFCWVTNNGGFPHVYLKTELSQCVFNKDGNCSLLRKPDVCASFPYGEVYWFGENPQVSTIECTQKHNVTVSAEDVERYFKGEGKLSEYYKEKMKDPFFRKWVQIYVLGEMFISKFEKESKRLEASEYALELFTNYKHKEYFYKQFDKNTQEFIQKVSK